jgi:hypothetical protein
MSLIAEPCADEDAVAAKAAAAKAQRIATRSAGIMSVSYFSCASAASRSPIKPKSS